jgi:hypothetical protein
MGRTILAFALVLAALAPAPSLAGGEAEGGNESRILVGKITAEDVECPAFRDQGGALYSLLGDLGGFGPGDGVYLRGLVGAMSYCMRGTPISVLEIAASCDA